MKNLISNYREFKEKIIDLSKENPPKKLLLHSCCAPCSTHVLTILAKVAKVTILFYNPNIDTKNEYDTRLFEVKQLIHSMQLPIQVVELGYQHNDFLKAIQGKETLGERSSRCYACYEERLIVTANYAKENGYDYFTTTLSISPYKNSNWLNEIGYRLSSDTCQYLYSNYKKENGYQHSIALSKQYQLYRQDYCGCEFSKKEHEIHLALAEKEKRYE